jgi:hypothetical protein
MDIIATHYNTTYADGLPLHLRTILHLSLVYNSKCETMLKKVTADKFAFGTTSDKLEKWWPSLPSEMTRDIMISYSRQFHGLRFLRKDGRGRFNILASGYHVVVEASGDKKSNN